MASYLGPIFDADTHHNPLSDEELMPYFTKEWQSYVKQWTTVPAAMSPSFTRSQLQSGASIYQSPFRHAPGFTLSEPEPKYGEPYDQFISDTMDRFGDRGFGITVAFNVGQFGSHMNPYYAAAVARAHNDWNIDTWLSLGDDRIHSEVAISTTLPEEAAKEIRRVGGHPAISGVCIGGNQTGRPLGDEVHDPIYAACVEMDLAVTFHGISCNRPGHATQHTGGNVGGIEYPALFTQEVPHFVTSLITHGTFERFPTLRVLVKEVGVAYLPYILMQLDAHYDMLKFESPWVKKWPSEYVRDHLWITTQPLEDSPDGPADIRELLASFDGLEDVICFSTDYPHPSFDDPSWVARRIPEAWWRKVFVENACDVFKIAKPPLTEGERQQQTKRERVAA
jgi:predicted TIM-barrel fold metal-dependent hydrolase